MAQGFTRGTPIDTDPNLSLDSDLVVPSQKAIKDYVDTGLNTKQDTITLTTTGTSGAATLIGATLNIPQYGGGGITELTGDVTAGPGSGSVAATLKNNLRIGSCGVVFDGGGQVVQTKIAYVQVPYNGILTSWTLVADVSGSCTITVFKDTYANFPPTTTADDVYVTAPSLSSQQKNQNLTPTYIGSQATVTAGDYIGFTISAITTITWANLTIQITKT